MESDVPKISEKHTLSKPNEKKSFNRDNRAARRNTDSFDPELPKRKWTKKGNEEGTKEEFDPELLKRKSIKKGNEELMKEEIGRKSYSSQARAYGSKSSEERLNDYGGKKNSFNSKGVQDIPVYNHEELQKPNKRKQLPKLPSLYVGGTGEKSKKPTQSPDAIGKKLATKRKRSVEEKLKIIETLTPDLVRPQERDDTDEIKSKAGRLDDDKKEDKRGKVRKFRIPGYRSSMEGLGKGCRKLKCKIGITRYDQFAVSDLMRMRLEAEDMRRTRPVANKPGARVEPKFATMDMGRACTIQPRVHNLEINDASLPPPINPLAYCYM